MDTWGAAFAAAAQLSSDAHGALLLDAARAAFTRALEATLTLCAVVSLALSLVAAFALRRSSRRGLLPERELELR